MQKFSRVLFSVLWIASAVLMVVAGVGVIADYNGVMTGIALWVGIVMVLSGVMELGASLMLHGTVFGSHSFITKGIASVAVGVLLLCQSFLAGGIIQIVFSIMLIVDAVSMFGAASAMKDISIKVKGKGALWVLAVLELLLGICGFIKPEVLHMALGVLIGISLIYEGAVLVYTWYVAYRWRKLR